MESHNKWHDLTRSRRHRLTQSEYKHCNALVESAFNPPMITVPGLKENNGGVHSISGHFNHY